MATQNQSSDAAVSNFELVYRRNHPKNRCSYGIAGNPGIVVFDIGLFAGSEAAGFVPPPSITLSCEMVPVKVDGKTAKDEERAAKAAEKAAKAEEKARAAQERVAEKARKAQEKADKAAARAAEAAAKAESATAGTGDAPAGDAE